MVRPRGQGRQLRRGSPLELRGARVPMPHGQQTVPARELGERSRAPKKNHVPEEVEFRTKPEIALGLVDRALANGIQVASWTFDEFYGRDHRFLDGLEERQQMFVAEVPVTFHGWLRRPQLLHTGPKGGAAKHPRVARRHSSSEVRHLFRYSPVFRDQTGQRYRIKDTNKGPEVWEVKWGVFWRKGEHGLPGRRHCLIVARNVLTEEVKYFVANCVPWEKGVTLRWLLKVAFGRSSVEGCFREAKEELGLDHYEVRGWRCVHRHFFVAQLAHLFCARIRQEYDQSDREPSARLTVEEVRSAVNTWLSTLDLNPATRTARYCKELGIQQYYQRRNAQARKSHTKTRHRELRSRGINPDQIKSCIT
jgi:SRSO17 transposase